MSYNNGIVLAPVGMGDISKAVGNSSLDIGTLIDDVWEAQNNKWSKYKPMRGMNSPSVWQKRGDLYNGYPARMGYMGIWSTSIDGIAVSILTAFGMDIPFITSASANRDRIIACTGEDNFNWPFTTSFPWRYYRMLDFDGYKPSATFPIEYGSNGEEFDPTTTIIHAGGRHADAVEVDQYRMFIGDLATFFGDDLVWGALVQLKNGQHTYTSAISYTSAEGDRFKLSEAIPEHSLRGGYADIFISLPATMPFIDSVDYSGGTGKIYTFAYLPPDSTSGYTDVAIILPSSVGATTLNPRSFTIGTASVTDALAHLSFNIAGEKWGRAYSSVTEYFPSGYLGYTLMSGTGIYAMGVDTSFMFSITFANRAHRQVVLDLGKLRFDVKIFGTTIGSDYGQVLASTRRTATYYDSNGDLIGTNYYSKSLADGDDLKIFVNFSNLWEGFDRSQYDYQSTGDYAVWMNVEIANNDFPTKHYTGGIADFFAKYENQSQTWKFNWTWDGTGPKKD